MELIEGESYKLSTGKIIHPNCGIIGITEVDNRFDISEGYDGGFVTEMNSYKGARIDLTSSEVEEIALYMSKLWNRWWCELKLTNGTKK